MKHYGIGVKKIQTPREHSEDDFWMTAEVWGHGVGKSEYFNYGFDSVINFTFQGEGGNGPAYDLNSMENTFSSYANQINTDSAFNVLSYISQHDTHLYPRDNLIEGGTFLMLLPGAVKVFYGDETARPFGPTGSDPHQGTRSSMNWDSINEDVLFHWQKMGQFRNRHIAIGAGEHQQISEAPYTFSRIYEDDEISDEVVVSVGANGKTTINVSSVFTDGEVVRDFYTDETATVINGEVTFNANDHGVILVEREGAALPNVSASPEGGEFEDESIDVTLHLQRAEVGAYTIDGSDPNTNGTSYGNGDTITLGTDVEVGESVTLRLHAENDAGSVEEEYIFTKVPSYAQVGADPPGGDFTGESIEVTLYAKNVNVASYSLNGVEVEYFDGDQIIIGENIEPGESMVLSLFAENEFGKAEEQYTYTKVDGLTIYFKKPQNWGTPHLYFYGTEPEIDEPTWTEAPEMEWVTGDWYSYKIEGTESAYVIFKDQDNQWPGSGQPGFFRDADGWFDGKWHDDNPEQPTIPQAPKNLRANQVTIDSVSLEWDTPDQQVDYYAIYRNGERIAESEIATFVDENLESSTAYIYYVVAVNPLGESSASEEFEIRTRDNEDSNKLTIYYQGFDQAYIHYKIGNSSWTTAPGEKMSLSSFENHHVITIDLDHEEELTAAFNNGRGQWDNNQGADYSFTSGIYTVKNGHVVEGAPDSVINDEKVTIYYYTNWDYPRIHYALSDGEWTAVPGVAMSRFHDYPEYAVITLNLGTANRLKAAFNNSFGSWDSNEGRDYEFAKGIYTLRNGQIFNGTPNNNFY
ncbi:carbohydrate binding domain-containing protein [Alkalihalobacillus hemicellulosilyticus]|nr:carbohydrate binding domain-containing protein [Halalkalibacter hemicellulosilyticus]